MGTESEFFSVASAVVSSATLADAPGAMTSLAVTSTSISVSWDPQLNPIDTRYHIQVTPVSPPQTGFTDFIDAPADQLNVLNPDTRYAIGVQAINRNGVPSPADYVLITTTSTLPATVTPAVNTYVSSATLSWPLINPADTQYRLLVRDAQSSTVVYDQSNIIGFNAKAEPLQPNTSFLYELTADGQDGATVLAASSQFLTGAAPITDATLNVDSTTIGISNVTTQFPNPSDTLYLLIATKKSNGQQFQIDGLLTDGSLNVSGLLSNTTYQVSAFAIGRNGQLSSPFVFASTPTLATPPINFFVTDTGVSSIGAQWDIGTNGVGTRFEMETVKQREDTGLLTPQSTALFARQLGLEPSTTYVVRVRAIEISRDARATGALRKPRKRPTPELSSDLLKM